jgi:xylulokinase
MGAAWILAVDLGNGGPKVAAVALDGTILAQALRGVGVTIESDGTATQDAHEWISATVQAVAEVTSEVDGQALHAVAITGQWGSSVPIAADLEPVGPVLLWADTRGGPHVQSIISGPISVAGYAPHKVLPWLRITGGAPSSAAARPTCSNRSTTSRPG